MLLLSLCWGCLVSAQMEDQTALSFGYGPGRATARLALTTIDIDRDGEFPFIIQDRAMRWMRSNSASLSLRHNVTGRVVIAAGVDYFSFRDQRFKYASVAEAGSRLRTRLEARNEFLSVTGNLSAHYRITPEDIKLDVQVGFGYQYTLYRHEYASYLRFNRLPDDSLLLVEQDREEVGSSREGAAVFGRVGFPVVRGVGFCLDVRYGAEQELDVFDQVMLTQVGLIFFFK